MESLLAHHPSVGPLLTERAQRAKLLEAMVQVVAEKGYAAATVADAVRLARVSRGTFYELFDSKEACLASRLPARHRGARGAHRRGRARGGATGARSCGSGCAPTCRRSPRSRASRASTCSSGDGRRRPSARRRCRASPRRYRKTFARSGRPVPPDDALFVLAAGIDQLACARVRAGRRVTDLEDTLVGCAVRLAAEEEPWT